MEQAKAGGVTSSDLKWIALGLMVLDHIHYIFGLRAGSPNGSACWGGCPHRCSSSAWRRDSAIPMTGEDTLQKYMGFIS